MALLPLALLVALPAAAVTPSYTHSAVAVTGDTAPGTGGDAYLGFGFAPVVNGSGNVAFFAQYGGGASSGVFFDASGTGSAAALTGGTAPGTGGGTYAGISLLPSLNDNNGVLFRAYVNGGTVGSGIFVDAGGNDLAAVLEGDSAPGTGGGAYGSLASPARTPINEGGDIGFYAPVTGSLVTEGIFRHSGAVDTAIALLGDAVPGLSGGTFSALYSDPAMNKSGDVAFQANMTGGSSAEGIFVRTSSDFYAAAVEGDAAPVGVGATYAGFPTGAYAINDSGKVPFVAGILNGPALQGLFVDDGGTDSVLLLVGDPAPDTGGGTYASFDAYPSINSAGVVAFRAALSGAAASHGIFIVDTAGNDALVALAGQAAPVHPPRTYDSILFPSINDDKVVAFSAALAGGAGVEVGVFRAAVTIPVPAMSPGGFAVLSLLLALGTALVLRRRRARSAGSA